VAAAAPSSFAQSGSSQNAADQSSPVFKTISDLARQYEQAYNSGDAKKVASFCAEDVDYIDQNGDETKGRVRSSGCWLGRFKQIAALNWTWQ
jgi:ketosteroid isomerase-like protein